MVLSGRLVQAAQASRACWHVRYSRRPASPSSPTLTGVYKNMRRGIVALVVRCRVVDGQVGASAEAAKVAWLSAEEVAQRMDEAYAMRLLDALRPGPPAVRAHDGLMLLPT